MAANVIWGIKCNKSKKGGKFERKRKKDKRSRKKWNSKRVKQMQKGEEKPRRVHEE